MRDFRPILPVFLVVAASVLSTSNGAAQRTELAAPCNSVELLSDRPLSVLPQSVQAKLRDAVHADVQAIMDDPGMGITETKLDRVPLNASEIARPAKSSVLFVVSWDDRIFGVNGFNWIVEVTPQGGKSLMSKKALLMSHGFGVEVLGPTRKGYPDLMFASKGYKSGGGAEAEDSCLRMKGGFYEPGTCPAVCHRNLNAR